MAEPRDTEMKAMLGKVKELDLAEDALDDVVHDVMSAAASNANNEGFEGQCELLVKQCGLYPALEVLEQTAKEASDA